MLTLKLLYIFLNQRIAYLYLYKGKKCYSFNDMEVFYWDDDRIANLDSLLYAIEYTYAFTLNECLNLRTVMVNMIGDVLS